MASSDGSPTWAGRLVPVPLWYLLAGGGGIIVGDNVVDAMLEEQSAQAAKADASPADDEMRASVRAISAKLDEVQAAQARMEGRMTSLERTVGELQQDVKTIKLAIR